jgi:peptidyl-prolyl cis-trans isomerase B (cyclophilin B)
MLRVRVLILLLGCAIALGACGGDDSSGSSGSSDESAATATSTPAPACKTAPAPKPKSVGKLAKPKQALDPAKTYVATVSTNCGDFAITLDAKRAPKTGGSFKYLADKKFFDGTTFHRIVSGFVIQGGDPKGNGSGGPGYSVVEAPPQDLTYTKGIVAMAKTAAEPAGTSGSQFFVVTAEDANLPPDYALLGKVTSGQDVVDTIGVAETNQQTEKPVDPIVIKSITVSAK